MAITKHVQHVKSNQTVTTTVDNVDVISPKLPSYNDLKDGEIAVNYHKDYETLSIRNDNNGIVTFPNSNAVATMIENAMSGAQDALTFDSTPTANSDNPVTSQGIKTYVDNGDKIQAITTYQTSTPVAVNDTHDQAISKLIKIIADNETTTAASLTDLNDNKVDAEELADVAFSGSYNDLEDTPTIPTVPTNVSAFTNDAGYLTSYTETDPIFSASAAAGITSTDISNWNDANSKKHTHSNKSVLDGITSTDISNWDGKTELFTINCTYNGTSIVSCDKTFSEIQTAHNNGKILRVNINQGFAYGNLTQINNGGAYFNVVDTDDYGITSYELSILSGNTYEIVAQNLTQPEENYDSVKVDAAYLSENGASTFSTQNVRFCVTEELTLANSTEYEVGVGSILHFYNDGKLTTSSANPATLTFNNTQIEAPMKQIFDMNLLIGGLMRNTEVYPEWWGAKGDGTTDDAAAINAALYNAGHVPVVLTAENYLVGSTVGVKESQNVNERILSAYNFEEDGKTAGTDATALRWDDSAPHYNMGHTIIIKHNLTGASTLNGTVLEMDECETTVRVEGAIIVLSASDNAVGFSLGLNGTSVDAKGAFANVFIDSITRDYNAMAYYTVTTSAAHCTAYNFGLGTGCTLTAIAGNITINHIYGFKYGVWLREYFQTNNLNVGQITAIYPLYIRSKSNSGYITRNNIDIKFSQTDKGLGTWNGGNNLGTEWITGVTNSALIYEDYSTTNRCEVAMNTFHFGDDNKAPQLPQNYLFYYNRTSGTPNHTGNKYTFNISLNTNATLVYFHQGTGGSKSVDDEFWFGVNICLSQIDVAGSVWNMRMHNVNIHPTANTVTRWGLITEAIRLDTVIFTQSSAPDSFNGTVIPILFPNPVFNGYITYADTAPATLNNLQMVIVDNASTNITTGGLVKYAVYAKQNGSVALVGYHINDELEPQFNASVASGITSTDISNWNSKSDSDVNVSQTAVSSGQQNTALPLLLANGATPTTGGALYCSKITFKNNGIEGLKIEGSVDDTDHQTNYIYINGDTIFFGHGASGTGSISASSFNGRANGTELALSSANDALTDGASMLGYYDEDNSTSTTVHGALSDIQTELTSLADGIYYDTTNKRIYLRNGSTNLSGTYAYIDATDFIKDGMVDTVTVGNGTGSNAGVTCLIITFNTDAGKSNIELPITQIFNASNYYTSSQVDNLLPSAGTGLTEDARHAFNHTNSVTANTNNVFKTFTYDAQGHITAGTDASEIDFTVLTPSTLTSSFLNRCATNYATGAQMADVSIDYDHTKNTVPYTTLPYRTVTPVSNFEPRA